ncbi:MAG: ArsC family reductase [Alphaproteobacteria bacterium]|nr:ArsC family reductase [Alphaproteobacteria bacterium]
MITIHGIKNCDTMKKARAWLDAAGIAHGFHDYRAQGASAELLRPWLAEHGWQALLNRAGTTFRKLPEAEREGMDEARAMALMLAQPAMIKRPVLDIGDRRLIGFSPAGYAAAFASRPGRAGA